MGPITLFDKSFLQSLSANESVWFDHFFLTNVCPIFYVETLADLEKAILKRPTPEQEVGLIAEKFPDMHGTPNAYHVALCLDDLLGHRVPMTGQILVAGGRRVKVDGKTSAVFEPSPEADAFSRWQKQDFLEIEHLYAKAWRAALSTLDLNEVTKVFRAIGIDGRPCKTLEEAKVLAESVVSAKDKPLDRIMLALLFLNIPQGLHKQILDRWRGASYPPLVDYAPYAAYVLTVEVFFQIALGANLISAERPSNRVDIAYLFYLPFCMMFVSSDRLHPRCAHLFLRSDQGFVWGEDLKRGLSELNAHYALLPDSIREKGVMSFASYPPGDGDYIVTQLWDRHLPRWRGVKAGNLVAKPIDSSSLLEKIKKITKAPPLHLDDVDFERAQTDSVVIKRRVRRRKGSWWQVPKDLEISDT